MLLTQGAFLVSGKKNMSANPEASSRQLENMFGYTPKESISLKEVRSMLGTKLTEIVKILPTSVLSILKSISRDSKTAINEVGVSMVNEEASEILINMFGEPVKKEELETEHDFSQVVEAYAVLAGKVVSAKELAREALIKAERQLEEHMNFLLSMVMNLLNKELNKIEEEEKNKTGVAKELDTNSVFAETEMDVVVDSAKSSSASLIESAEESGEKKKGVKEAIGDLKRKTSSLMGGFQTVVYSAS
jgi:hypothetical protein